MKRLPSWLLVVLAILGVAALSAALYSLFKPYQFRGMVLQSPNPATDVALVGQGDKPVKLSDYRGKLVLLYFGYTYCPDVCPTTLAEVAQAMKLLGKQAADVQVIMVTVDPERDTPPRLAEYVAYFNPSFVGLSGTPDQIAAAATAFGVFYEKHEGTPESGYLVDHTATISVLDREGRVKLIWPYGTAGEDMAADLTHLLD